jgi:hypothetical protein
MRSTMYGNPYLTQLNNNKNFILGTNGNGVKQAGIINIVNQKKPQQ